MNDIRDTIIKNFENNLYTFKLKYQYHWCSRMYRITEDEKYIPAIFSDYQYRLIGSLPKMDMCIQEGVEAVSKKSLEFFKPTTPKKQLRYDFYMKYPEVFYLMNLTHFLFLTKSYNLHEVPLLSDYFEKGMEIVKESNFPELLTHPEFVNANPSQAFNESNYLSYLSLGEIEDEVTKVYKDVHFANAPKDDFEVKSQVYGLTHIIIAASVFYQKHVDAKKYKWIYDFFAENMERIVEATNADIVAEVGVCFKLANLEDEKVFETVSGVIEKSFDEEKGFIPHDKSESQDIAEHRNVLAVLFLSDMVKLFEGPDLAKYALEKKRGLYLPKEYSYLGVKDEEFYWY